jgi:hypothetical protein
VAFSAQLSELDKNPSWGGTERVKSKWLFDVSKLEADGSLVKKNLVCVLASFSFLNSFIWVEV